MPGPDDPGGVVADAGGGSEEDREDELEAAILNADAPFGSGSFGTTAAEQVEGASLDERLAEERPSASELAVGYEIEEADGPEDDAQMLGEASAEHDRFVAPEDAATTLREEVPGAVDHPDDHGPG
jgi:hypothetical protein